MTEYALQSQTSSDELDRLEEGEVSEITEELVRLRTLLEAQASAIENLNKKAGHIDNLLRGGAENKGLVSRVDILEGSDSRRTWWLRTIIVAIIGLFTSIVMLWLSK